MSKNKNDINQLSPELLEAYLDGTLSNEDQHKIEKLALASEFESDAIEGYAENDVDITGELNALNKKLEDRIKTEKNSGFSYWLKIAATVIILATATILILEFSFNNNSKTTIGQAEKIELPQNNTIPGQKSDSQAKLERPESNRQRSAKNQISSINEPEEAAEEQVAEIQNFAEADGSDNTTQNMIADVEIVEKKAPLLDTKEPKNIAEPEPITETEASEMLQGKVSGVVVSRSAGKKETTPDSKQIKGKVISDEDGAPLPGVNVIVKGTTTGTVTDVNGEFTIDKDDLFDNATLVASFIGFENSEVPVENQEEITISLGTDVSQLSEVVVTGYSRTQKDKPYSYSGASPSIGIPAYKDYLKENAQHPPGTTEKLKGKVVVKFDINPDSSLSNFVIKKSLGKPYDDEALRLIKEGPAWGPAKRNDVPVSDRARVVVKFEKD